MKEKEGSSFLVEIIAAGIVVWLIVNMFGFTMTIVEKMRCKSAIRRIDLAIPGHAIGCWLNEPLKGGQNEIR